MSKIGLTKAKFDCLAARLSVGQATEGDIAVLEPYRVKRAILLAAGFGSRMAPVTLNTPKPLVRVHGKRIIDSLLDACLAAGIEEIYLVRGYLAEQFDQLLYQYPMIRFLENPDYNEANNISSALCASHLLSNAYVLEADLVLHTPQLIQPYQYRSNFLAIPKERTNDWCFTVQGGIITGEKIGGEHCWQMVGISYWDELDGEKLAWDLKKVYEQPRGRECYWEQVPLVFCRENYQVAIRPCQNEDVTEIDTFCELKEFDKSYDIGLIQGGLCMDIKRNILLNPGPATTTDSVKLAQVIPDICPREKEFASLMAGLREDLVRVIHGNPEKIAAVLYCGSGTLCMDVCLNSLLPEGKKALIIHNGAYSARAVDICRYYSLPHIDLELPYDRPAELSAVEQALRENSDIALVYATHNETGTGLLNPIQELGALAHTYGAIFVADTTSTYAMRPIDIEADNIDFCMASAQKGLMSMTGLSFVIGRRDILEASKDYPRRSYYNNLFRQYNCFERTGEMEFTPPVQTVYAAIQAMKEYWEEGEQAKWARHTRVLEAIHKGLEALGFREAIKREWQAGLVATVRNPDDPNWKFERVHDYCFERGFTIYPGKVGTAGTFRLCALGAIDVPDIEAFFLIFRQALNSCGVTVPVRYREETL